MNYLNRLKTECGKASTLRTDKTDKSPSVSFVSTPSRRISEIGEANDPLPDRAMEARRQRVLTLLADRPTIRYAVLTDTETDPKAVIVALAIRDIGTCELRIPRERFDPFLLLEAVERQRATLH